MVAVRALKLGQKMPQVIAAMIAGYSLYAGLKWLSRTLSQGQDAAKRMEEEVRRQQARAASNMAKDLGTLEFDPETGVYRPREPNAH